MLLDSILVHPDTQEPIRVDWDHRIVYANLQDKYKVGFKGNVPYILPIGTDSVESPDINRSYHSHFDYVDHYHRDAEEFDYFEQVPGKVDREERKRLDQIITAAIPPQTKTILDVGCGNAWLARAMVNNDTTVVSMDVSTRNPVQALKKVPHFRHEALIADVYHLPIKENSIDCVVGSEIMEHVTDPRLFIEKLIRVLRPGGKLIITTPYNEVIQYHLCIHCNRPTPAHAHLHSFHEDNVAKLIPEGMRGWKVRTFSHKYLNKSRIYLAMCNMPFKVWNSVDNFANKTWPHPMRLMLEIVK